jgi:hypothetical protein
MMENGGSYSVPFEKRLSVADAADRKVLYN